MVNLSKKYNMLKISDPEGNSAYVLSCLNPNDFMNRMRHCYKKGNCPSNIAPFMEKQYKCETEESKLFDTQAEYFIYKDEVKRMNFNAEAFLKKAPK